MNDGTSEQGEDFARLEELKMSLRNLSTQDRNPFLEVNGDTLKVCTDYGFTRSLRDIMESALGKLESDARLTDVKQVDGHSIEATLIESVGGVSKVSFYAYKDM